MKGNINKDNPPKIITIIVWDNHITQPKAKPFTASIPYQYSDSSTANGYIPIPPLENIIDSAAKVKEISKWKKLVPYKSENANDVT